MLQRNVTTRSPTGADAGRPTATAAAAALLAVSLAAFTALCVLRRAPLADAFVYRAEGAAVAHGTDLYAFTVTEWHLPATYPPFAALLFVPAAWIGPGALKAVFVLGNTVLLAVLVRLSCRLAGLPARLPVVCAATALGLWLEPVFQTVLFGQINLAVVCVVLWDLTRPPGAPGRGLALGVAAGVKLTPAVFVVYLLITGRRREAGLAAGGFAGTVLLGALVLPAASAEFWTRRLWETDRVGKAWIVDNQSLQGLVARVLGEPSPGSAWLLPAAAVGCAGLWLARTRTPAAPRTPYAPESPPAAKTPYAVTPYAVKIPYSAKIPYAVKWPRAWRLPSTRKAPSARKVPLPAPRGPAAPHRAPTSGPGVRDLVPGPHPDRWGVLCTALTALLVSPISWSHHWVWCVPLIAVLYAERGPRPAAVVAAVFTARTLWLVPHQGDLDLRLAWWQQPPASPYPLLGLLLLAQLSASSSSASRIR